MRPLILFVCFSPAVRSICKIPGSSPKRTQSTGHCCVKHPELPLTSAGCCAIASYVWLSLMLISPLTCRYFYRSQTDLGRVENSDAAATQDEPVLEAELDVDALAKES